MKLEDLHEGMAVRVIGESGRIPWDTDGVMDGFIGQEVTVFKIDKSLRCFLIEEDTCWLWSPEDVEPVADELIESTEEEFLSILFI